ncbi:MAG: class I SAM-dependent methyltransferase [Chloroflexota bacterium]|nr:class I SAM-dependent methyltransferase [Chloroflexota bacterium]
MDEIVPAELEEYAAASTTPEPPLLQEVARKTEALGERARMLTGRLEGRLLNFLVGLIQPRQVLEIGCFTGYSALSMAEALPAGGKLYTCEISREHADIAQANFDASPVGDRIELRFGPALDTIAELDGPFGFVFVDADKANYPAYYEAVLPKLAEGGLIAFDNVLWSGRVLDDADQTADTKAIRALNEQLARDERVEVVMLTVRDGLTLVRRRASH